MNHLVQEEGRKHGSAGQAEGRTRKVRRARVRAAWLRQLTSHPFSELLRFVAAVVDSSVVAKMDWRTTVAVLCVLVIGCCLGQSPIESANYNAEERKVSR